MPRRTFFTASFASASVSIEFKRQPVLCAQPDELFPMITVDASTIVERCSTKIPLEFATPIAVADVVKEPAAEHPVATALRQITPTREARSSGVQSATAGSKLATEV